MRKSPDKKVIIPALLFLPIIAGILLFLALAALADERGAHDGKCADGLWPDSGKRVYAGEYKDLSLMRKLKVRSMLFAKAGQLDTVAVAYKFPSMKVLKMVQKRKATQKFAELILHGKMAFAKRKADTLSLIASPRVLRTGLMDKPGDKVSALKWMGKKWGPSDKKAFQAWKMAWNAYSKDTRATIDMMVDAEAFALTDDWKDIVVLSAEEAIFGVCNEGRVVTWDGEKPLPDIDIVAQKLNVQ